MVIAYRSTTGFSKSCSYKAVVQSSPLAKLLATIGIPYGDKTQTAYGVPNWIMHGSPEIKRSFLKTIFNFDGSISLKAERPNIVALSFVTNRHKDLIRSGNTFLCQLSKLLSQFSIKTGKIHTRHCNKNKFTLILSVTNGRSVINFHRHIGFLNKKKNSRLEQAALRILSYRRLKYCAYILKELKQISGTDKEAVKKINSLSKIRYTHRQFEHMGRGESDIPADMLNTALKIMGKKPIEPLDFIGSRELH